MAKIKEDVYICKSVGKTVGLLNETVAFEFHLGHSSLDMLYVHKDFAHEIDITRTYTREQFKELRNKYNGKKNKATPN